MADAVNGTRTPVSQTSPEPSRRTILAELPVAAVAIGALAAPALAAAPHPDASLLALEPDLKALNEHYERTREARHAAEGAYVAERRALPRARRKNQVELQRLRTKHGLDGIRAANRDAARRVDARFADLANARATTLDGFRLKARWAEKSDAIPPSIIHDLKAI